MKWQCKFNGKEVPRKGDLSSSTFTAEEEGFFLSPHIRHHLNYKETVQWAYCGCDFQTNVYGTFATHKSRRHTTHSVADFKPAVLLKSAEKNIGSWQSCWLCKWHRGTRKAFFFVNGWGRWICTKYCSEKSWFFAA